MAQAAQLLGGGRCGGWRSRSESMLEPHARPRAGPARGARRPPRRHDRRACAWSCSPTWARTRSAPFLPTTTQEMLSGVYRYPADRVPRPERRDERHAGGAVPRRGRPEATALVERAMDLVAAELGMDPVEVRRKNLIPADAFPYTTASGTTYDVGRLRAGRSTRRCGCAELRGAARRAGGAPRTRRPPAAGDRGVHLRRDHVVLLEGVRVGRGPRRRRRDRADRRDRRTGRGTRPRSPRSSSAVLGVPFDAVRVVHSDTGRRAARRRDVGLAFAAGRRVGGRRAGARRWSRRRARWRRTCSRSTRPTSTVPADGRSRRRGARPSARSRGASSRGGRTMPRARPPDIEPGLAASGTLPAGVVTFPFGAHVAVVEVDTRPGDVRLLRHVAVDDCGRILNPMLVEGQVHGGLAQGIAQALYEEVRLRRDRQPDHRQPSRRT